MSKIAIKGATTGTGVFTLESPATNTDRTLVLPDEAGTVLTSASGLTAGNLTGSVPASAMPAGSVIQVVQMYSTTAFSTTSTSFVDVTGYAASITPTSSSSKILVMIDSFTSNNAAYQYTWIQVVRNSTVVIDPLVTMMFTGIYGSTGIPTNGAKLDSPNTTSPVTYKVQIRAEAGTSRIGAGGTGAGGYPTALTLMEISA